MKLVGDMNRCKWYVQRRIDMYLHMQNLRMFFFFFTSSKKFLFDAKKTFDTPKKQVQTFPELHLVESVQ